MDSGRERNGIKGCLCHRHANQNLRNRKPFGVLSCCGSVVGLHGLGEALFVNAGGFGQIFEGIGFIGIAVREGNLYQIVTHFLLVDGFLIEDRVDHLTGLLKDAVRNFIAPARFIHEAQSELIHVGRILRTAGNGGFEFSVFRIAVRMDLNPLHAFERSAGLDGGFKHFARRARLVRSSNNGDVVVLLHHLEIGAVAAGGEDDIFAREDMRRTLHINGFHAGHSARRITFDLGHLHRGVDRAARGFHFFRERSDVGIVSRDRCFAVSLTRPLSAGVEAADAHINPVTRDVEPRHVRL